MTIFKVKSQKSKVKTSIQKLKFLLLTCAFAFYLLSFTFIEGCVKKEIKNIDSQGKNIICFGDSITFGYGAGPGEDFPNLLAKMIDLPVINAGVDGDTSSGALKRLGPDVLAKEPLLVIIEFGGNDFLEKIPFKETLKNSEEMIKKIQAKGAMVAVADISTAIIMNNYGKEYRKLSQKYNTIFIPHLLSGILTNPSLKSDYIHPNAKGYKLIAQRVYQAIKPYLNQNPTLKNLNK